MSETRREIKLSFHFICETKFAQGVRERKRKKKKEKGRKNVLPESSCRLLAAKCAEEMQKYSERKKIGQNLTRNSRNVRKNAKMNFNF